MDYNEPQPPIIYEDGHYENRPPGCIQPGCLFAILVVITGWTSIAFGAVSLLCITGTP